MSKTVKDLVEENRVFDIFIVTRMVYRFTGKGLISDATYNDLEKVLIANPELVKDASYLSRTYDDDPINYELLYELGLDNIIPQDIGLAHSKYADMLNVDKTNSINSVTSDEETWNYLQSHKGQRIVGSIKADGVNSKTQYIDVFLELCLSRARHAAMAFDYTKALSKVLPTKLPEQYKNIRVYSESFVETSYLPTLREKYDTEGYKTPKSSAMSVLRVSHDEEDYKHLRSITFAAEGLTTSLSENFRILKSIGFEVVPYIIIEPEDIPATFEEFKPWINEIFYMFDLCTRKEYPSDGIVLEVDDLEYLGETNGQYSTRQIALKYNLWKPDRYKGVVTEILCEQRRVQACCKVKIEPLITNDMCKAKIVNCYNPGILVSNKIYPGTEVSFERNSGAVNIMIRDKDLEKLLRES